MAEKSNANTEQVALTVTSSRKVSTETHNLKQVVLDAFPNGMDHSNLMEVVVRLMRYLARKQKRLTGQQKKKLLVDALLLVLDETDSGSLEVFEPLVKNMVPTIVDNLIDVEKGKIKLNKNAKCLSACGLGCIC